MKHTIDKIWIMRDGEKIHVNIMDDDHIINCIKMMRKNLAMYDERCEMIHEIETRFDDPQTIEQYVPRAESNLSDDDWLSEKFISFTWLVEEAAARGLEI